MHLTLMRHGEPARDNPLDPGLTELGRAQAASVVNAVRALEIDVVCASPLRRARETADVVAAALGVEVHVEPDLAEFDRGAEYRHWEDGADVWVRYLEGDLTPWGTTLPDFAARVNGVMESLRAQYSGRRVLAVCHGGVVNTWACQLLGVPERVRVLEPAYASLHRSYWDEVAWRLQSLNETCIVDRGLDNQIVES